MSLPKVQREITLADTCKAINSMIAMLAQTMSLARNSAIRITPLPLAAVPLACRCPLCGGT